jgi:beta-glucanase (GH16 family)
MLYWIGNLGARVSHRGWPALLLVALVLARGETASSSEIYRLVWADEFDQAGPPDANNWTFERGFVRNEELQWYQPDSARCEGGRLVIEARREPIPNPRYDPESPRWQRRRPQADYSSACLTTRGRHQWLYGRFEMRGRIDTGPGLWPAFWTLGTARPWPGCGEIDVMEYYRNRLLANAAWQGPQHRPAWDTVSRPLASFNDPQWGERFHDWRMDWNKDSIKIYVDDELINQVDVAAATNDDPQQSHPFREPHYLLLNLAVGGTQGGDPAGTEFPAQFVVDFVRVYQPLPATSESE